VAEQYFANGILHHNSGKTFLLVRNVVFRALKAPNSRHAIFRFRYNHLRASVVLDTFPKVMRLCFPGVPFTPHNQDGYVDLGNGSQIWFAGLDDKERTERVLGQEFSTLYFNECSQIPLASIDIALTRLAQKVEYVIQNRPPALLKPRCYYDCNPPNKAHWTYRKFIQKVDAETRREMPNPDAYASIQINPVDNTENVSAEYLETLNGLSTRLQKRFLRGEFADATPNALFTDESIDRWRITDGILPDMVRIVIAVDPSGAGDKDNADNDAIGIAVCGLGTDGNCYVLEDLTVKAGPATWGKVVCDAYDRHEADAVVGETNYGGAMVQHVIQTARPRTNFRKVTATRGKVIRAEPVSALYEQGKVRHVGYLRDLEEELLGFTTTGYVGGSSPNRADALVWGITALFPGVIKPRKSKEEVVEAKTRAYAPYQTSTNWMSN
jgi:predicted phage terminase large subunit-like protein